MAPSYSLNAAANLFSRSCISLLRRLWNVPRKFYKPILFFPFFREVLSLPPGLVGSHCHCGRVLSSGRLSICSPAVVESYISFSLSHIFSNLRPPVLFSSHMQAISPCGVEDKTGRGQEEFDRQRIHYSGTDSVSTEFSVPRAEEFEGRVAILLRLSGKPLQKICSGLKRVSGELQIIVISDLDSDQLSHAVDS
jgi:hypothetical protein